MRDLLAVRLSLPDQRLQPSLEVFGRRLVKAVVDLAGIDQVLALVSAYIDAIELVFFQREARDRQRLALGTGFLQPVVAMSRMVTAVPDLGDDALKATLASVLVHFAAVDLEILAELNIGAGDELLEQRLALYQRQLTEIVAIEIKQIERYQHDLLTATPQIIFQPRE